MNSLLLLKTKVRMETILIGQHLCKYSIIAYHLNQQLRIFHIKPELYNGISLIEKKMNHVN